MSSDLEFAMILDPCSRMQKLPIEQFRALAREGKLKSIAIIGEDGCFYIQAQTSQGSVLLKRTRSEERREFRSMTKLLSLMHELDISNASIDIHHWRPELGPLYHETRSDKASALKESFLAAKLTKLLEARIREADCHDNVLHDANEVFNELEAQYAS